jgi:TPR repeat protein
MLHSRNSNLFGHSKEYHRGDCWGLWKLVSTVLLLFCILLNTVSYAAADERSCADTDLLKKFLPEKGEDFFQRLESDSLNKDEAYYIFQRLEENKINYNFVWSIKCSIHWVRESANKGNADGMLMYADILSLGGKIIPEEAMMWLKKAAEKNHPEAMSAYAQAFRYQGKYKDARYWYKEAAKEGDVMSMLNYAIMSDKGEGGAKNVGEAMTWYKNAAKKGHVDAMFGLAKMYENCEGMSEPNYSEAKNYYEKHLALNKEDNEQSRSAKTKLEELKNKQNQGFFPRHYDKVACWF